MEVKVYYSTARDAEGRPLRERGRFVRQGCIENYASRLDPDGNVDGVVFETDERGLSVHLSSLYTREREDGAVERVFDMTICEMPDQLAEQGWAAADPYDFFEIAGAELGIYRVDLDGEVYWTPQRDE